ncbi:MAG: hypothetical protein ACI4SL_08300, partial [Candidatus Ornithospirochaeta sp.]
MEKIYEIHITDRYNKNYWLFVVMNGGKVLASLDRFLRDIWCGCGHLSEFRINGSSYSSNPSTGFWSMDEEEGMDVSIDTVLYEGMKFSYIYDFGSSTELVLTVKSVRMGNELEEGIRLIARNDMPEFKCSVCKKRKAKYVNPMAYYEDDVLFLCNKCFDLL